MELVCGRKRVENITGLFAIILDQIHTQDNFSKTRKTDLAKWFMTTKAYTKVFGLMTNDNQLVV